MESVVALLSGYLLAPGQQSLREADGGRVELLGRRIYE